MNQRLHTPEGVRDIYDTECRKKGTLERKLHQVMQLYGYQDIQTPTFEYFDVFRKEIGTIPSRELYKFFDREGETLVLRPDITPSIARAAATLYETEKLPVRLCYIGNTFINHSSYQGRLKENTQLGAELIGVESVDADAEMIAMAADCLKAAGLTDFQITLGHVAYFKSLLKKAALEEEKEEEIRELVRNRNFFGMEEVLRAASVEKEALEALTRISEMTGGPEILALAEAYAPDAEARQAIERLKQIHELLKTYQVDQYVTFDLSMSGLYGYYSGIIFRAYTFGTGDAILKGGRYDHLLEKFGKTSPSIGFAVVIGELMNALNRQKIQVPQKKDMNLIIFDESRREDAILLAGQLRLKGQRAEVLCSRQDITIQDYCRYGQEHFAEFLMYLKETQEILLWNLSTGEQKIIKGTV